MSRANAKNDQAEFKSNKREMEDQKQKKNLLYNIEMLNKVSNSVTEFFDVYSSMVSETKLKAAKGLGLKTLTHQQMLQILPIALAQVKAGNNSENLLNEI